MVKNIVYSGRSKMPTGTIKEYNLFIMKKYEFVFVLKHK